MSCVMVPATIPPVRKSSAWNNTTSSSKWCGRPTSS